MNFVLPQFIEMESKIVGPLTMKQFFFIGIGTAFSLVLYLVGSSSPGFFIPAIFLIVLIEGTAIALAFIKVGGTSLPSLILNSLKFRFAPKIYLWKKFESTQATESSLAEVKFEKAPSQNIRLQNKPSQLKQMRDFIETKTK